MGRERGAQAVARLRAEAAQSDELGTLPALAPERVATTTQFFQDLVLLPLLLRALFGEKLKQLCAEIGPHVKRSVAFFLAACRHGGVASTPVSAACIGFIIGPCSHYHGVNAAPEFLLLALSRR